MYNEEKQTGTEQNNTDSAINAGAADTADTSAADAGPETDTVSNAEPEAVNHEAAEPAEPETAESETAEQPAAEPSGVQAEVQSPVYTWSAAEQLMQDKAADRKKGRHGALVYAITVTVLFAVCLALLGGLLVFGYMHGFGNEVRTVTEERVVYVREDTGSSGMLTVQEIAAKVTPSIVYVEVVKSSGTGGATGFVITDEGHIATNYHVIEGATSVKVIFEDSEEFDAVIVGGHEMSDLAVIKIDPAGRKLTVVEFGYSSDLLVGDSVVAIGNPGSIELFASVSTGIISGLDRKLKFYDSNGLVEKTMNMIQINCSINPGNSGGPLLDMYGRVIGINSIKLSNTYNYEGVAFSIPSDGAVTILNSLIETGEYSGDDVAEKGVSLGVSGIAVIKGAQIQIDDEGNTVTAGADGFMIAAFTGEDASAYGVLQLYDIITHFEGKPFTDIYALREHLATLKPGDQLNLTVYRDGKSVDISVTMK